MRKDRSWMRSVPKEAAKAKVKMPGHRGGLREDWIAKRDAGDKRRAASA